MKRCALLTACLLILPSCETVRIDPEDRIRPELIPRIVQPARLRAHYSDGAPVGDSLLPLRRVFLDLTATSPVALTFTAIDRQSGIGRIEGHLTLSFVCHPGALRLGPIELPFSFTAPAPIPRDVPISQFAGTGFTPRELWDQHCSAATGAQSGRISDLSFTYFAQAWNNSRAAAEGRAEGSAALVGNVEARGEIAFQ